jgi:hypothetical protein
MRSAYPTLNPALTLSVLGAPLICVCCQRKWAPSDNDRKTKMSAAGPNVTVVTDPAALPDCTWRLACASLDRTS